MRRLPWYYVLLCLPAVATSSVSQPLSHGIGPIWGYPPQESRTTLRAETQNATLSLPEDAGWESYVTPSVSSLSLLQAGQFQGKLLLFGDATAAAHQSAGSIVLWDGVHFEALPPAPSVRTYIVWNDQLVVATLPLLDATSLVLRLTGTHWDTLGVANRAVTAMTTFGNQLVVVGAFTSVSGIGLNRVAQFDGVGWLGFGSGLPATETPSAVVDHAGILVVGESSASAMGHVEQWNAGAGSWQTLGAGFDAYVTGLVSDGVNLYASGGFHHSGTTSIGGVGRWDGATWNSIGTPLTAQPSWIAMWNGKAVFPISTGASRLMVWNGVSLSTVVGDSIAFNRGILPSNSGALVSATAWGNKLVVTGRFFRNGSVPAPGILVYDGTQWTTIGEPWTPDMQGPVGTAPITDMRSWSGHLVVAGPFGLVADGGHYSVMPGIAQWDGAQWKDIGGGIGGTDIWLGEYQGDLIAAGWLTFSRANISLSKVIRWNGSSWTGFGSNAPDFANSIQQLHNDLYIGSDITGLTKWNGSAWSAIPVAGSEYALMATPDSLVVGGDFPTPSPNVAFWDGSAWQAAGAGVNGVVHSATNWMGRIVVGGDFTASGATQLPGAAIWDGTAWQPLGTNVVVVDRLRIINGELYASGDFKLPDNSVIETVARYNGVDWQILGSGSNNYIFEGFAGELYQAGQGVVHGHVSHNLSRRALPPLLDVPGRTAMDVRLAVSPNPAANLAHLTFTLTSASRARLTIVDLAGREVATLVDGSLPPGSHDVKWTARSAPGVYFARLQVDGLGQVVRFVRLREQ